MRRPAERLPVGPRGLILGLVLVIPCGCEGVDRELGDEWAPPGAGDESDDGAAEDPTGDGEPTEDGASGSDPGHTDSAGGGDDGGTATGTGDEGWTSDDAGTSGEGSSADETTGGQSDVCDGIDGEPLIAPVSCDGPGGNTTTEQAPNDLYATSWFGCYMQDNGTIYKDPYDNCEFACGNQGLCPPGQDGPTCEANLRWFAADADRFGCGGRIRVTNCENGNAVILVTLDRGPNCNTVEKACDAPVLDMSHDAMVYLFDGGTYGGCDHQAVVVEEVDPGTPLGPV